MSDTPELPLLGVGQKDQVLYAEIQTIYREQIANKRREVLPQETTVMVVTPQIATEWLKRDTHNRPLRIRKIREWADEMKSGNWKFNGQSISFKKNGELNDGQHRLWASVISKRNFKTVVVIDADNDGFVTVDTGMRRSAGDILALEGFVNQGPLSSAAKLSIAYEATPRKRMTEKWASPSGGFHNKDVLAYVEGHRDLAEVAKIYSKSGLGRILRPAIGIFCWTQMRAMDRKKADAFMEMLATGSNLNMGHPVLTLREELRREEKRLFPHEIIARVIRAWNAYAQNRRLERLWFRVDGWAPNFGDEEDVRDQPQIELRKGQRRVVVEERLA